MSVAAHSRNGSREFGERELMLYSDSSNASATYGPPLGAVQEDGSPATLRVYIPPTVVQARRGSDAPNALGVLVTGLTPLAQPAGAAFNFNSSQKTPTQSGGQTPRINGRETRRGSDALIAGGGVTGQTPLGQSDGNKFTFPTPQNKTEDATKKYIPGKILLELPAKVHSIGLKMGSFWNSKEGSIVYFMNPQDGVCLVHPISSDVYCKEIDYDKKAFHESKTIGTDKKLMLLVKSKDTFECFVNGAHTMNHMFDGVKKIALVMRKKDEQKDQHVTLVEAANNATVVVKKNENYDLVQHCFNKYLKEMEDSLPRAGVTEDMAAYVKVKIGSGYGTILEEPDNTKKKCCKCSGCKCCCLSTCALM